MNPHHATRDRRAAGFSILEVVFALAIIMVVALGLLPLGVIATTNTENQGHLMARATEYSQDKMEQLLTINREQCAIRGLK